MDLAQRFIAFLLLLSTTLFIAEPVVGELYDGALHSEAASAIAAESGEGRCAEHPAPTADPDLPGPHAEHCTHQHGTLLGEQLEIVLGSVIRNAPSTEIETRFSPQVQSYFRPPRL